MSTSDSRTPIITAAIHGIAVITCAAILTASFTRTRTSSGTIRVTGSARQQVRSDYIIWSSKIKLEAPTQILAYQQLQDNEHRAIAYLLAQGLSREEISTSAIKTESLYPKPVDRNDAIYDDNSPIHLIPEAYRLTENVEVRSTRVPLVESISRKSTDLLSQGVAFTSQEPQYVVQNMAEIKAKLLEAAGANARTRAENIAASSGTHLGKPQYWVENTILMYNSYQYRDIILVNLYDSMLNNYLRNSHRVVSSSYSNANSAVVNYCHTDSIFNPILGLGNVKYASMGVMQVTPAYEDEQVSDAGTEDTTALDKKVTAIVSVGYGIR